MPAPLNPIPLTALKKAGPKQDLPKPNQAESSKTINLAEILAARGKLKKAATSSDDDKNKNSVTGGPSKDFSAVLKAALTKINIAAHGPDNSDHESENSDFE
ncbi:hypothetical protein MTO96_000085 [Rhipicephalus appendiculatus]